MENAPVYTLVLGISDPLMAQHLSSEILVHPRFDLVGSAPNAVMTQTVAEQTQPDLIVMSDESPGIRGASILDELLALASQPLVIMTTSGEVAEPRARQPHRSSS